jgi:hypothetical protein
MPVNNFPAEKHSIAVVDTTHHEAKTFYVIQISISDAGGQFRVRCCMFAFKFQVSKS